MDIPCRLAFCHVADRCKALIRFMAECGPSAALDMDDLLLREAMDVIGERLHSMLSQIGEGLDTMLSMIAAYLTSAKRRTMKAGVVLSPWVLRHLKEAVAGLLTGCAATCRPVRF
jgi:hypothetical protein